MLSLSGTCNAKCFHFSSLVSTTAETHFTVLTDYSLLLPLRTSSKMMFLDCGHGAPIPRPKEQLRNNDKITTNKYFQHQRLICIPLPQVVNRVFSHKKCFLFIYLHNVFYIFNTCIIRHKNKTKQLQINNKE